MNPANADIKPSGVETKTSRSQHVDETKGTTTTTVSTTTIDHGKGTENTESFSVTTSNDSKDEGCKGAGCSGGSDKCDAEDRSTAPMSPATLKKIAAFRKQMTDVVVGSLIVYFEERPKGNGKLNISLIETGLSSDINWGPDGRPSIGGGGSIIRPVDPLFDPKPDLGRAGRDWGVK